MKRVRVTRVAEHDLDEIWFFIARDNVEAANRIVDEVTSRFSFLGMHPEMGRSRDELKQGLRSHPVDNYVISHVSVLHIIHGARDPVRVFKK